MLKKYGLIVLSAGLLLSSCDDLKRIEEHDPELKYDKKEYAELLTGRGQYAVGEQFQPKYYPPKTKRSLPDELYTPVSVSMTDQLPLIEAFMELGRQAKINVALSPKVQGGIFFQAHKQPAIDVIEEVCHIAGLRYSIENKTVRVEPDQPYMKSYNLQFLALSREKKNRVSVTTDVFTSVEGNYKDFDNGSSTLLTGDSKVDFWDEFEQNIGLILSPSEDGESGAWTAHRQAGIVTVTATQAQHKKVAQYIQDLLYSSQLQVVIEAKIVEVNLADEFKSGINWQSLQGDFVVNGRMGEIARPGRFNPNTQALRDVFTIGGSGSTLTALASVLSKFGTVRTLSSPRVTVLNNQTSVLKVATNRVFFRINYFRDMPIDGVPGYERASSQIQTVPIGLVMVVQPSIDVETGRITMTLRPTISRVIGEKEDPAVAILSNNRHRSTVPEVQVRELDSVLQMESGDTIVMGGLMEDRSDDDRTGVPGLKDVPLLGMAFGGREQVRQVSELVIFLRATVQQIPVIDEADQRVYEKFTRDPRPLQF